MLRFDEVTVHAPTIANPMIDRLRRAGIGLLGTIRADGSPRVSPIEVSLHDDRLWLGMMPGSMKLLDVVRDPRVALLTPVADRDDLGGEGKLFGHLVPVADPTQAEAVLRAHAEAAGFDPEAVAGSPLFELLVTGAAWQHVDGDTFVTRSWRPGGPVLVRRRAGATGEPVDES
jgi:hypothetical protein